MNVSFAGGISAIWFLLWTFTTYSSPDQHPRIGKKEKDYIMKNIGESVYDGVKKFVQILNP